MYVCAIGLAYLFFSTELEFYLITWFSMLMQLIIDEGLIM